MTFSFEELEERLMLQDPHVKEVLEKANYWLGQGANVYFKWTCLSCKSRCLSEEANSLHTKYVHTEPQCGAITPTVLGDLGFAISMVLGRPR